MFSFCDLRSFVLTASSYKTPLLQYSNILLKSFFSKWHSRFVIIRTINITNSVISWVRHGPLYGFPGWRQRHSALISSDSEMFQFSFSVHYLKISEKHWKQNCSELKIGSDYLSSRADFWRIQANWQFAVTSFFLHFRGT